MRAYHRFLVRLALVLSLFAAASSLMQPPASAAPAPTPSSSDIPHA